MLVAITVQPESNKDEYKVKELKSASWMDFCRLFGGMIL